MAFSPSMLACPLVSSLLSSHLGCPAGETLWALLLMLLEDETEWTFSNFLGGCYASLS